MLSICCVEAVLYFAKLCDFVILTSCFDISGLSGLVLRKSLSLAMLSPFYLQLSSPCLLSLSPSCNSLILRTTGAFNVTLLPR